MTIFKDVLAELLGMFLSDARLSAAILAVVGLAAALIRLAGLPPLAGGAVLLAGCLVVLTQSVRREARRRRS